MLANTLSHVPRGTGLQCLQRRGEHGARELTSFRLRLDAGGTHCYSSPDEETVVVLQEGAGVFEVEGVPHAVSRTSVFRERACAVYLPPGCALSVRADTPLEAVLISTPAPKGGRPSVIGPDAITPVTRGRDVYMREVHNLFVNDSDVRRLIVGETINAPGHWSSYPPHKHDGRDGEAVLEEVYHYRVDPPQGFGLQMLYTADGEAVTHIVHDGDAVLVPYGYHPVSAPPGYRLYYLWGMAGADRKLALHEDPAHRWVHDRP